MNTKKFVKLIIVVIVVIFFYAYITETSGYYEYSIRNKSNLTEEQIKRFEEDVKEGRDIDINEYTADTSVDYSNKLTKTTTKVSLEINSYLRDRIRDVFRILDKMVEE